jgi:hypothetical protein
LFSDFVEEIIRKTAFLLVRDKDGRQGRGREINDNKS